MNWLYEIERCKNNVYAYNGLSELLGEDAIVIIGYGFLNSKYYWLIQNSLGENASENGFLKIEFCQIRVEGVGFSEPYIHKEIDNSKDIPIELEYFDKFCDKELSTTISLEDWKNTLDLEFKNSRINKPFNFQCSSVNTIQRKVNKCYFEYYNFYIDKGLFRLDYSKSLREENTFSLSRHLSQKEFIFIEYNDIFPIYSYDLFVSQEGSNLINILFYILLLLIIISIILISFLSKFILQAKNLIEFNSKMIFKNHLIEDIKNFNSSNLSIKEKKLYKMLCPRDVNGKKKILVGNFGDGGYVLFDDFEDIKIAYSFGINKEISFDKYLANKGINVYMYDHTIDSIPSNDTKLHWKKIGLGTKNSNKKNLKSLEELLLDNGHINEKNMILKIDIEHNEWDPLTYNLFPLEIRKYFLKLC